MSEVPLVSIIINNYNYARFLKDAIDSALTQTYPNVEVIVVDDGSTDNSREVVASYGNQVTAVLKENEGQASAFNAGFAVSRGAVVTFLDSDDMLLPSAVETAIEPLRNPSTVKVHWPLWEVDERGQRTGRVIPSRELATGNPRDEVIRKGPTSSANAPTSGNAWSRSFLEEVLPVREYGDKHGADAYLFTLAPIFGLLGRLSEPQGCYRVHPDSFSRHSPIEDIKRDLRRYHHHCAVLQEHLGRQGTDVDSENWMGPNTAYAWMREMLTVPEEIQKLIPTCDTFILIDEDQLGQGFFANHTTIPFLERDGQHWGQPADDEQAVHEVERLRQVGASFIVFISSTFWWLEHYPHFYEYLRSTFCCALKSDHLVVYDLVKKREL